MHPKAAGNLLAQSSRRKITVIRREEELEQRAVYRF